MIAVSIVTYKTELDELSSCLKSVLSCQGISRVDVIDNSSQAYIERFITNTFPQVHYQAQNNVGYGAANNISIRRSLTDQSVKYHLVINTDIIFSSETVSGLIEVMETDPAVGLVMPAVIGLDGLPQSCCHPLPTPFDLLRHRLLPKTLCLKWRRRYDIIPQNYSMPLNVPYMHGCFMLFRLDALRKSGLFDERFFMYPEDIDITRRMHRYYSTLVLPQYTIVHAHRAASRHSFRMFAIHAWNMIKYFNKWGFIFDSERRKFNRELQLND